MNHIETNDEKDRRKEKVNKKSHQNNNIKENLKEKKIKKESKERLEKRKREVKGSIWIILLTLVVSIFALSLYYNSLRENAEQFKDLAAVINGENITLKELNYEYNNLPLQLRFMMDKSSYLDRMINNVVLYQEAKKENVSPYPEFNSIYREMIRPYTEEEYKLLIKKQGKNFTKVMDDIKETIVIEKYLFKAVPELYPTEEELNRSFANYKEILGKPIYYARHIVVNTSKLAREIKEKLDNGANFSELSKEYSLDPYNKDYGGVVGWFRMGETGSDIFEKTTKNLSIGEISEPVKDERGFYHIIQLLKIIKNMSVTFNETKAFIEFGLFSVNVQKKSDIYLKKVHELRNKSKIFIFYSGDDNTIELSNKDFKPINTAELNSNKSNKERKNKTELDIEHNNSYEKEANTKENSIPEIKIQKQNYEETTPIKTSPKLTFIYIQGDASLKTKRILENMNLKNIEYINYSDINNKLKKTYNFGEFPALICNKNNKTLFGGQTKDIIERFISMC